MFGENAISWKKTLLSTSLYTWRVELQMWNEVRYLYWLKLNKLGLSTENK